MNYWRKDLVDLCVSLRGMFWLFGCGGLDYLEAWSSVGYLPSGQDARTLIQGGRTKSVLQKQIGRERLKQKLTGQTLSTTRYIMTDSCYTDVTVTTTGHIVSWFLKSQANKDMGREYWFDSVRLANYFKISLSHIDREDTMLSETG